MKKIFLFITLTVFALTNTAQETDKPSLDNGSINQQFEYLFEKSRDWKIYKTVKKTDLNKIRKNVKDSISALNTKLAEANVTISSKENDYLSLQSKLEKTNLQLDELSKSQDSISMLGISLSKNSFKTIFWSIISLLSLILFYFVYSFKNSNKLTKDTLANYSNLEEEFNNARTRALEREQILNRKLLDEQNKNN